MYKDPIVAEVRKARAELAKEADGDLGKLLANLRVAQRKYRDRMTDRIPKPKAQKT
jgi:hypothetical protein